MAQVHRFHDKVAAYLGNGATVYMTPADARWLARSLSAAARDIKERPSYGDSQFRTVNREIEMEKPR